MQGWQRHSKDRVLEGEVCDRARFRSELRGSKVTISTRRAKQEETSLHESAQRIACISPKASQGGREVGWTGLLVHQLDIRWTYVSERPSAGAAGRERIALEHWQRERPSEEWTGRLAAGWMALAGGAEERDATSLQRKS